MNTKTSLFAAGWALSCGAAFFIGRTSSNDPSTEDGKENATQATSSGPSRTISRNESPSSSDPAKRGPRVSSTGESLSELQVSVDELLAISDPITRTQGFLKLVENLRPDQFLEVVDYYRSFGVEDDQFGEYGILLTAWAKVDPLEALTYSKENTSGPFARQTILASWAKDDPDSAIAWAKENFDAEKSRGDANPWLVGVIKGLVSEDMARATDLIQELPYSRNRSDALDSVFDILNREGTEATKDWIAKLTDERLQAGAASRLAERMAETNPKEAIAWAESIGEEALKNSVDDIVEEWAESNLEEAQKWVESQPVEIAAAAAPELIDAMIDESGAVAASDWLSQHEGDPAFDRTVQTFAWNVMRETPELGADWIMRMTNKTEQRRTFHRVLSDWARRDLQGASEYTQNNPVPEGAKERIEFQVRESQKSK